MTNVAIETLQAIAAAADCTSSAPRDEEAERLCRLAHDFNNVLAIILGYADVLQAQVEGATPPSRTVEKIRVAVSKARDLTSQLVEASRNASNRYE